MANKETTNTQGIVANLDNIFDGIDAWWSGKPDSKSALDRMATIMMHMCAGAVIGILSSLVLRDVSFIFIGGVAGGISGAFSDYAATDRSSAAEG